MVKPAAAFQCLTVFRHLCHSAVHPPVVALITKMLDQKDQHDKHVEVWWWKCKCCDWETAHQLLNIQSLCALRIPVHMCHSFVPLQVALAKCSCAELCYMNQSDSWAWWFMSVMI
jgi:hypothetical protein